MKPHEDALEVRFNGGGSPVLTDGGGAIVAVIRAPHWEPLFLAAPDMARALVSARDLIEALAAEDAVHPEYTALCAALAKAGVLP